MQPNLDSLFLISIMVTMLSSCKNDLSNKSSRTEIADPSQTPSSEVNKPVGLNFTEEVIGLANLDNDSGKGADYEYELSDNENDLSQWQLPSEMSKLILNGHSIKLSLPDDHAQLGVWHQGSLILGKGSPNSVTLSGSTDLLLAFEFGDFNIAENLTIEHLDENEEVLGTSFLKLRSAPMLVNHHLQPAEHVYALRTEGNEALISSLETVLGDNFTALSSTRYQDDIWVQDEIEFATSITPDGKRQDIIIDSIRDRGLAPLAGDIATDGTVIRTWGNPNRATTFDSFGNLEATPPITVDGVNYPFGRIYYGANGRASQSISGQLRAALDRQQIQKPFAIDTSWLCVGHVDEFSTFIPDLSSPKGFKLLISDTNEAYKLLATIPRQTALPRYAQDFGYNDIGAILDDEALRIVNESLQTNILDDIVEIFKKELGLDDSDIIRVPSIFENDLCGDGTHGALLPGMVNMLVAHDEQGNPHLFIPDPFMRANATDQNTDPFIEHFTQLMPDDLNLHYVDDWDVYHMGMGEIHCGTNSRRTPMAEWWKGENLITTAREQSLEP